MSNTAVSKLPPNTPTMRAAIVGMSGSGKGNCAKAFCAREQKRGTRIAIFDPDDEYSSQGKPRPGQIHLGSMTQRVSASEFEDDPGRHLDRAKLALSVVPDEDDDEAAAQCATFAEHIKATGNLLAVFDEIGGYAFENEAAHLAKKALNKIATKARKDCVSALFVSQRMVHIPTSARAQINALEIFAQSAPADLKALEELTGNRKLVEQVQTLPAGVSLLWVSPMLVSK